MSREIDAQPVDDWVAVVPVKALTVAKSRLGLDPPAGRAALAAAFAVDTVRTLLAVDAVRVVAVVCSDRDLTRMLTGPGVQVLDEPDPAGLNSAARLGIAWAVAHHPGAAVCVLPADLPSLLPHDVATALRHAARSPRAVLADHEGTGSVLLTGLTGTPPRPCFGVGSLARHVADGAVELDTAGLSHRFRDVDTAAHLQEARRLGLGPATSAVLDGG